MPGCCVSGLQSPLLCTDTAYRQLLRPACPGEGGKSASFLRTAREEFPIRPNWQRCTVGRRGNLRRTLLLFVADFPRVPLGQTLLNVVGACRDVCPKAACGSHRALPPVPAPAHATCRQPGQIQSEFQDHWGLSHQPPF